MTTALQKVAEAIGNDIIRLTAQVMDDDNIAANHKTGKNTMKDSALRQHIRFSAEVDGNIVITTFFDNYIQYVENGRPAGKMPPISALEEWAKKRNIPTDNNTLYAIATAIKRDGIAPRPILATLEKEMENAFDREWADKLFEALTTALTKYFN